MESATDYIFGEFDGVSKIELMKLMLDYLYEEMPLKFERNEDMMCWIQEKLMEEEEEDNTFKEWPMETFKDQMNKLHNPKVAYDNVYPLKEWTLDDYKSMFEFISMGYLVQANDSIGFVINEEWDDDEPMWVEEFCDECGDGLIQDSSEPYCEGVNCKSWAEHPDNPDNERYWITAKNFKDLFDRERAKRQMIPFEHTSAIRQVNQEMKTLFENYGLFASTMENYKETEGLGYWRLLEDSPYTNGEVLLDGWNSQDDFKRARGDWSYYEEDEKTYKCSDCDKWITATEECCGEEILSQSL